MAAAFEMYRWSAIGMRLTETLDEMVFSGRLTPELAILVLLQFDQGNLHTYRYCDCVWTFNLRDVMFRNEEVSEKIGKLKIVASDSNLMKPKVPPRQY